MIKKTSSNNTTTTISVPINFAMPSKIEGLYWPHRPHDTLLPTSNVSRDRHSSGLQRDGMTYPRLSQP